MAKKIAPIVADAENRAQQTLAQQEEHLPVFRAARRAETTLKNHRIAQNNITGYRAMNAPGNPKFRLGKVGESHIDPPSTYRKISPAQQRINDEEFDGPAPIISDAQKRANAAAQGGEL